MSTELSNTDPISAERIIAEAYEQRKKPLDTTKVEILDLEELKDWQQQKRTEYETVLKRNRLDLRQWMRYAKFELEQNDVRRARSIFERALLINQAYIPLWIQYIESELKLKNVNHARNLLDRATNMLPRVDKLWYKYLVIEESLGNVGIARGIYTRWCSLEPGINAWDSFIEFEIRHKKYENARNVFSRYVLVHPIASTWLKWVSFEEKHGDISTVRKVFSLALDTLTSYDGTPLSDLEPLIVSFANWEASQKEYERAKSLFELSMQRWPQSEVIKEEYVQFEKKFGSNSTLEYSLFEKRKKQYQLNVKENPLDYSSWWLLIDLYEVSSRDQLIPLYDSFVDTAKPDSTNKDYLWKRYIHIWSRYLVFVEVNLEQIELARNLYQKLLKIIPHRHFTFAKVWIMYAEFELRQENLTDARKILGTSLGKCGKPKLFKYYIEMELKLKEFDRVRKIYEKYLDYDPSNTSVWIAYAELEENLGDESRARAIYNISLRDEIEMAQDDRSDILRRFIAFETDSGEYDNARALYQLFLSKTHHSAAVWIEWALFESTVPTAQQLIEYQEKHQGFDDDDDEDTEFTFQLNEDNKNQTRAVFEKAISYFKDRDSPENRKNMLEALLQYEQVHGTPDTINAIRSRLPQNMKKIIEVNGIEEEHNELDFPDDHVNPVASNLLALARKWDKERSKE